MSNIDDLLVELKETYINSFHNQTNEIESYLLALEKGADFQESFEALYRRVHSIKGSAGTYGFSIISSICHQMEDFLTDDVDINTYKDKSIIDTLFAYLDLLCETHDFINAGNTDFKSIEQKLENISRKSTTSSTLCLCVGLSNSIHQQIIKEIATNLHIHCSYVDNSLTALERLMHEQFDIMITARENTDIDGVALIGTLRLNNAKNANVKSILVTSNPKISVPDNLKPDYIVKKDQSFAMNLQTALSQISSS